MATPPSAMDASGMPTWTVSVSGIEMVTEAPVAAPVSGALVALGGTEGTAGRTDPTALAAEARANPVSIIGGECQRFRWM